jgi:hypothetical protein
MHISIKAAKRKVRDDCTCRAPPIAVPVFASLLVECNHVATAAAEPAWLSSRTSGSDGKPCDVRFKVAEPRPVARKTILIVDDESEIAELFFEMVGHLGY